MIISSSPLRVIDPELKLDIEFDDIPLPIYKSAIKLFPELRKEDRVEKAINAI
jgi:hypothetical protein